MKWRYHQFEMIGKQGNWFIIKNNQAYIPHGDVNSNFRGGYIELFRLGEF